MTKTPPTVAESSGVQELIERLREQGVAEGRSQADALLEQTRRRAEQRLADARREAEAIILQAREEATQTKQAGEEAVRLAVRDAILRLKSELVGHFADRIRRLVTRELADREFLRQLILEVAGNSAPAPEQSARVLLPRDILAVEDLRHSPEDMQPGTLSNFAATVTQDLLREGIQIGARNDDSAGIRIELIDDDVEIDLTDRAVADLLLRHLVPRFRGLMEGIVQ